MLWELITQECPRRGYMRGVKVCPPQLHIEMMCAHATGATAAAWNGLYRCPSYATTAITLFHVKGSYNCAAVSLWDRMLQYLRSVLLMPTTGTNVCLHALHEPHRPCSFHCCWASLVHLKNCMPCITPLRVGQAWVVYMTIGSASAALLPGKGICQALLPATYHGIKQEAGKAW